METRESLTEKITKYFSLAILLTAIYFVAGLNEYAIGYTILIAGGLCLYLAETAVAKNILLLYVASSLLLAVIVFDSSGRLNNGLTAILGVFSVALPVLIASFIYRHQQVRDFFLNNKAGFPKLIWRLIIVIILAWASWTLLSFKQ